ncbi:sidestep V [Haematobia irritans]|uniref:sidestep V n=1 Tax=Haematobia irritans TaxID=7368 RepID=UPI003F5029DC
MYRHIVYYVTIGLIAMNAFVWRQTQAEQHPATADEGPLSEVQTAVGLEVALPCDLMPGTMIADKVQLVIWYRQGNVKPIYTFDARGRSLHQGIPWADENVFKHKAHFYYDSNPPALRIKNIQPNDAGLYKCRVDFHKSPTRNWRINVTVLVPPTHLTILDDQGAAIRDQTAGPYLEGESINITCLSSGGVPPPRVSWWREHALVDDSFQILPDGTVRNILQLKNISRKDLLTVYTCQASNGHVVAALTKKFILDMNLPPLSLLLQGLNHALVAGTRTHVTCTAVGARPAPQIIWSKGGQVLKGATHSTSSDGNTTVSELILIPVPEDNERTVQCSISLNPQMTSQHLPEGHTSVTTVMGNGNLGLFLKDSRILNVTHAPIVSLSLGAPLDPNNLLKGSDVFLDCEVRANPGITKIEWYHNDKQLHSSRGIIISNQTLVLQAISKSSHGQYFCRATNIQGSVSSNEVYLDVKYPPVCKSESTIIRAALKQTINITCQVDANPLDNLNYKWHFNNSLESLIELPSTVGGGGGSGGMAMGLTANVHNSQMVSGATGHHAQQQMLLHADASHASAGYYQRSKRKHLHSQQHEGKLTHGRHGRMAMRTIGHQQSVPPHMATWPNIQFEDDDDGDGVMEFGKDGQPLHRHHQQQHYHDGIMHGQNFDDDDDNGDDQHHDDIETDETINGVYGRTNSDDLPYTQMVYSNMIYKNHLDGKQHTALGGGGLSPAVGVGSGGIGNKPPTQYQPQHHQQQMRSQPLHEAAHSNQYQQLAERKRLAALHKQQHHRIAMAATTTTTASPAPLNNVYSYHIESYESFGAISCVASSAMGQSQPCWYHVQPADLPEPVKNCSAYNFTANSMQIQCIPGYDGGIPQHFHVQVYDELNRQILYNTSFRNPEFTVKRLPSDSVFVLRITAVNAQGPSKVAFRLRGRTLSAPLLRTASSTAVLVQLTPLLGALVGVIATLVLVAICIVIFMKFRTKHNRRGPSGDTTTTEADKGSAEPLSRNMGSHSSLEDKNPDVIPQETNSEDEFHLEEKAFDRLNMESQRIIYTPTSRMNAASPPPPSLSPTFGKQYGELSLTTNPAFSLYNTPQRAPATQRPVYTAPPPLLSTRTPPNIYTRIPGRTYLPAYETRTSPTSPYGSTTTCTMPLLGGQSNGSLQTNSSAGGTSGGGLVGSLTLTAGNFSTLPHPHHHSNGQQQHHQQQSPIPTALTSSLTSGNITIGAAQSLLTSPRTHSAYSSSTATTQSPLLAATSTLLGSTGNYETISS